MTGFPHPRRFGALTLALAFAFPAFQVNAQGRREGPVSQGNEATPPSSPGRSVAPPPPPSPRGGQVAFENRRSNTEGAPSQTANPGGGAGPNPARSRTHEMRPQPTMRTVISPRPMVQRRVDPPDPTYWRLRHRDISREIQWMARSGFIAMRPILEDVNELTDFSQYPAGWRGYGFAVPPGEKIHIRLHHPNEGWFSLRMMNKWGELEPGMLQNLIPTGNPEVSYKNLTKKARAVYMLVDDPGWMSGKDSTYKLVITRSWDPKQKKDTSLVPLVDGVWAVNKENKEEEKPKADAPKGAEATKG